MKPFDIHTHRLSLHPKQVIYACSIKDMPLPGDVYHHSVGIHPWYLTEENAKEQLAWLHQAADKPGVRAIGECGLDKLHGAPLSLQQDVFKECIEVSERTSLPLIIHAVKCTDELIRIKKEKNPKVPWILHGFRGKKEIALQYLKQGFYLSFGEHYQEESLRNVPLDRLFIETDESTRPIEELYQQAAGIYGISLEAFYENITSNVQKLFFTH